MYQVRLPLDLPHLSLVSPEMDIYEPGEHFLCPLASICLRSPGIQPQEIGGERVTLEFVLL